MFAKIPPVAWFGLLAALLIAAAVLGLVVLARRSARLPGARGLVEGRLAPCPASPNCVSSEDGADPAHRVDPLPLPAAADPAARLEVLQSMLRACGATSVRADGATYLHATFATPLLGFVDDVELRVDEAARVVHVRSASRVGHSDLGANRARVERLRRAVSGGGSQGPPP